MKQKILDGLPEILRVDAVTNETKLGEVAPWDSLAIVMTISLFDEAGFTVRPNALEACETVGDIMSLCTP